MAAECAVRIRTCRSHQLKVLHLQLNADVSVPLVELRLDRKIDRRARLKFVEHVPAAEGNAFHMYAALPDEKLEVIACLADAARRGSELHVTAAENRLAVAVTERAQPLELGHQRFGHVLKLCQAIQT